MPKCQICKETLKKGDSFCYLHTTKSGKLQRKYYCNREEFHKDYMNKVYYNRSRRKIDKILGYVCVSNEKNKMITRLYKAGYDRKDVLDCIISYQNEIMKWLEIKNIDNEYQKLRYIFTVIENNIKDFSKYNKEKPTIKKEVELSEDFEIEMPSRIKHKRRGLKDRLRGGTECSISNMQ